MCLYVDQERTEKALQHKTGKVIRWKVVELRNGQLQSVYQHFTWKPGWNKSGRRGKDCVCSVHSGIHVFVNREEARYLARKRFPISYWLRIIKVVCYRKDLIAVGRNEDEAYMKVFVPKDEHDDALKREGVEKRNRRQ